MRKRDPSNVFELDGVIASVGFESGDRIVIGSWDRGPLGPMSDAMWVEPDGRRVLLAPTKSVGDFVSAVYAFEDIRIVPLDIIKTRASLRLKSDGLEVTIQAGRPIPIPFRSMRMPWVTRHVEGPIAKRLLDVNTYGSSPSDVEEWYRASELRWVNSARASVNGGDLGPMTRLEPELSVGFSDPPKRPSMVRVRPLLHDRSGRLAELARSFSAHSPVQ